MGVRGQGMPFFDRWFRNNDDGRAHRARFSPEGVRGSLAQLPNLADGSILACFDPWYGGFGQAAKQADGRLLAYTVERYAATGQEQWREVFSLSLDAITRSLFDETEGSFRRGAAHRDWSEPYLDKPLDVCAEMTIAYLSAHRATGRVSYAEVAIRAVRYLASEVQTNLSALDCRALASAVEALCQGRDGLGCEELLPAARLALNEVQRRLEHGQPASSCAASLGALLLAARVLREPEWLQGAEVAADGIEAAAAPAGGTAALRLAAMGAGQLVELALVSGRDVRAAEARRLMESLAPLVPTTDCGTLAALADGVRALNTWTRLRTGGRR